MVDPNTPILIGVGQCVDHWDGSDVSAAPSPALLMQKAAETALADVGAPLAIDRIAVVRTMLDSVPGADRTRPGPRHSPARISPARCRTI